MRISVRTWNGISIIVEIEQNVGGFDSPNAEPDLRGFISEAVRIFHTAKGHPFWTVDKC